MHFLVFKSGYFRLSELGEHKSFFHFSGWVRKETKESELDERYGTMDLLH